MKMGANRRKRQPNEYTHLHIAFHFPAVINVAHTFSDDGESWMIGIDGDVYAGGLRHEAMKDLQ